MLRRVTFNKHLSSRFIAGVRRFVRLKMIADTPDLQTYAIGLGFSLASCIVAAVLTEWEETVYFSLFFPAILLSATIGGAGPACLTLVATFFWSWVLLTQRSILAGDVTQSEAVALAIFIINAGIVALTGLILRQGVQILTEQARKLRISEERLDLAQRAGGVALWDWDIKSNRVVWNDQFYTNWDLDRSQEASFETFLDAIHPDDRDAVRRTTDDVLKTGKPYQAEYRVPQSDGSIRWMSGRGRLIRDGSGYALRMIGVNIDITARKRADEQQNLLLAELNHRVKNTLATVQSLMFQSSRSATDFKSFRSSFEARILALAKTHNLLTDEGWAGARLNDVIDVELEPYAGDHCIEIQGEDTYLSPALALAVGMIVHELATNAAKYGCLSSPTGQLQVSWSKEIKNDTPWLHVRWVEEGGPPVRAPTKRGFGSALIERTVYDEHGGFGEIAFYPTGVTCTFDLPLKH